MVKPKTMIAFSKGEYKKAHDLLASKVATMMGRKLEEGDWTSVYCAAKGLPYTGWSNLNIDVSCKGFGVEHKMLCVPSDRPIREFCGTSKMHPAATRSIRVSSTAENPTTAAHKILQQYAELIEQRRQAVAKSSPNGLPDVRVGWLLWQETLKEFLYFEVEMIPPDPSDYYAEWMDSGGGSRKKSKNLWVYEKETGRKRYSITTTAGAKIQPYFDIPSPDDPGLFYFCVQGEEIEHDLIRIWVTKNTAILMRQILGTMDSDALSSVIIQTARASGGTSAEKGKEIVAIDQAEPIIIKMDAYQTLRNCFSGVSDEHMMQLFLRQLSELPKP